MLNALLDSDEKHPVVILKNNCIETQGSLKKVGHLGLQQ